MFYEFVVMTVSYTKVSLRDMADHTPGRDWCC